MSDDLLKEEIAVLFQAALLGRTDIVQTAISSIRACSDDENTVVLISSGRNEDGASPLHLAALNSHSDVIRYLLNANADLDIAPLTGIYKNKRPYDVASEVAKQAFHVYLFEQIAIGRVQSINRLVKGGVLAYKSAHLMYYVCYN
jgi:ankyrin repeat protein